MIAAKWGDPVAGVDIHMVNVPTPGGPVPTPLPHPFIGVVFDPIGAAMGAAIGAVFGGGGPVLVNGMMCGNTGTGIEGLPHIPTPPGVSPAPNDAKPSNSGTLLTGSKTVHFGGSSESRTLSSALSCNYPVELPTSLCMAVPMGSPVVIGGPEAIDLTVAATAAILAGLKAIARTKWASNVLKKITGAKPGSLRSKIICTLTGHPVDVMTGELLAEAVDFAIPGLIPIVWERNYRSRQTEEGQLGPSWRHPFEEWIEEDEFGFRLHLSDGRFKDHLRLAVGEAEWEPEDRYTLSRTSDAFTRRTAGGLRYRYEQFGTSPRFLLTEVRDRAANRIRLEYERGYLAKIVDTAGRELLVRWNGEQRIREVSFEDKPLVRYEYDAEGRLAAARDPLGHALTYAYRAGLLVRETHKSGLSFHFEWDWEHTEGWCIRTWGDGGIYDRKITYDKHRHFTVVEDGRGGRTHYWGNDLGLVTKTMDPMGVVTETTWDEWCRKTSETDGLGAKRTWTYDERGNCVRDVDPLGHELVRRFNDDCQVTTLVDRRGGNWRVEYDRKGRVACLENPLGVATTYTNDERGRVVSIDDPMGRSTRLGWNDRNDLVSRTDGENRTTAFAHDSLGAVLETKDPAGRTTRLQRDANGLAIYIEGANGEIVWLTRDEDGNVVERTDSQGRKNRMRYAGLGRLVEHIDPMGHVVRLEYDLEEELVGVVNQAGERHAFELDRGGRVVKETSFDGRTHRFFFDRAGRASRMLGPDYKVTFLERDALGRVTKRKHKDREESYSFDPAGSLLSAAVDDVEVSFVRDALGRVVTEQTTLGGSAHAVESRFDYSGCRLERRTGLGHQARYEWNRAAELTAISAGVAPAFRSPALERLGLPQLSRVDWSVRFERDELGLELSRALPGGVEASWRRDEFARPLERRVTIGAGGAGRGRFDLERTGYEWQSPDQIAALVNVERGDRTKFDYDPRGHLVRALLADGTTQERASDAVSNLYGNADRSDRTYGPGGRLERVNGTELRYDGDGNLVSKTLADGARWTYAWTHAGRLSSVKRPDGKEVRFTYDALGRRVRKEFDGRSTEYVWDRDTLVHERVTESDGSVEPVTTWVFEPGTFSPVAKLEGRQRFGIVSDHLGVPTMLLTEAGEIAWKAQLDLYGVPREEVAKTRQPWRFPGQYEDEETGLYYNRFRYYDPESGRYISQDPIGLLGGLALYGYVIDPLSWLDPLGLNARCAPGVASGVGKETGDKWLRGTHGNAGWFPSEIADKMRGRQFKNFDSFREAFWKEVAADSKYADQFSPGNVGRMEQGLAPIAVPSQWAGQNASYNIHHVTPIQHGGGVYDMDNMLVATPQFHQEVLDPAYHY